MGKEEIEHSQECYASDSFWIWHIIYPFFVGQATKYVYIKQCLGNSKMWGFDWAHVGDLSVFNKKNQNYLLIQVPQTTFNNDVLALAHCSILSLSLMISNMFITMSLHCKYHHVTSPCTKNVIFFWIKFNYRTVCSCIVTIYCPVKLNSESQIILLEMDIEEMEKYKRKHRGIFPRHLNARLLWECKKHTE